MIQTIISLARNMQLAVVAEGVETIRELDLLRSAGCDRVQGHLFGASLQARAAEQLLARPNRRLPIAINR